RQAGEEAAGYVSSVDSGTINGQEAEHSLEQTLAPLGKEGAAPKEVLRRIQALISHCDVSILKTEKALKMALEELQEIREEWIPNMGAADSHYLLKLEEVRAIANATEYNLTSALFRKDSRAGHYRADYPEHYDD